MTRRHAEEALRITREYGFRVVEGQALTVLCRAAEAEPAHPAAVGLGREAPAVHRGTGHRLGEARALLVLARALRGTAGDAELVRQQALEVFSEVGVPPEASGDPDR
ncbi:hypothetical protein AB0919_00045 [Streptomyces sp. NPDC046994]|uniref:hypothetical protein n=1 Tax=Streptomyces sp. NPDC046994 TaxID=3155735 RepID=UPI003455C1B9